MDRDIEVEAGFGTSGVETTVDLGGSAPGGERFFEAGDVNSGAIPGGPVEQVEGQAKRVVLASIGAVASACDVAEETFDRFVDRGERLRSDWQGKAEEVRMQNAGARTRMRDYFRTAMDMFLDGINVPNKGDVDTINVKLNILTRKLDDLQMQEMRTAAPVTEPPSAPSSTATTGDLAT